MKKLILIFFIFFSSFSFAQNNRSIEGTTWRGLENGRETEITFLPNGIATYSNHNGISTMTYNSKWSQNGNSIYWEINNKFAEKNGQVRGDTLSGTAKNIKGFEWTFEFKLLPPNSAPFNPSKELALEQNRLWAQRQQANTQNASQPTANTTQSNNFQNSTTEKKEPIYNQYSWRHIGFTSTGEEVSIDLIGAEKEYNNYELNIAQKYDFNQSQRSPAGYIYSSYVLYMKLDCSKRAVRYIRRADYDNKNLNKLISSFNLDQELIPVTSNTIASEILDQGCARIGVSKYVNDPSGELRLSIYKLLQSNWGWDDQNIKSAIEFEAREIKKKNPEFNEDQVMLAQKELWIKRAREKNNPNISPLNTSNSSQQSNSKTDDSNSYSQSSQYPPSYIADAQAMCSAQRYQPGTIEFNYCVNQRLNQLPNFDKWRQEHAFKMAEIICYPIARPGSPEHKNCMIDNYKRYLK